MIELSGMVIDSGIYLGLITCITLFVFIILMRSFDDSLRRKYLVLTFALFIALILDAIQIWLQIYNGSGLIYNIVLVGKFAFGFVALGIACHIIVKYVSVNSKRNLIVILFVLGMFCHGLVLEITQVFKNCTLPSSAVAFLFLYMYMYAERYNIDSVSKCYKRRCFYNDSKKYSKTDMAIISMDLNDLKFINDNYGHKAGDIALLSFAEVCRSLKSKKFILYRTGGDEFMMLGVKASRQEADDLVNAIREKLRETPYACSFGVNMYKPEDDFDQVVVKADEAMYADKRAYKEIHGCKDISSAFEERNNLFTSNINF